MKIKIIILFLLGIVVCSSCSRKYYSNVDKVIPPKVTIPANIKSITLLDRAKEKNLSNRVKSVVTAGVISSNKTKNLLREAGSKIPVASTVYSKSMRHSNAGSPAPQLNKTDLKKYAGEQDGLLTLDLFLVKEFRTFESIKKHQLDENGNDYIIDAVRGTRVNSLKTLWRLYNKETGAVIITLPYEVEEVLVTEGLSEEGANSKLDTLNVITLKDLTDQIVSQITTDFTPRQIKSNWMYFKKGDKLIEKSGKFIGTGNFKNAIRILQSNQPHKTKNKIRAIYNLSTALFLDGQIQKAIKEAKKGVALYKDRELKELLSKIERK